MTQIGIQLKDSMGNNVYPNPFPIGAIYLSVDSRNPASIFGGTWEQIQGRFLLGAGGGYVAGNIGGESSVTLTLSQMPSHTHTQSNCSNPGNHQHFIPNNRSVSSSGSPPKFESWPSGSSTVRDHYTDGSGSHTHTIILNYTGDNQSHNNMPPYFVVYIWKRVS